jgi:hypothetical protein
MNAYSIDDHVYGFGRAAAAQQMPWSHRRTK